MHSYSKPWLHFFLHCVQNYSLANVKEKKEQMNLLYRQTATLSPIFIYWCLCVQPGKAFRVFQFIFLLLFLPASVFRTHTYTHTIYAVAQIPIQCQRQPWHQCAGQCVMHITKKLVLEATHNQTGRMNKQTGGGRGGEARKNQFIDRSRVQQEKNIQNGHI